jgi:glycosyltransferase involved in cell wall biosynthesis
MPLDLSVTIGMPVFNSAATLPASIASLRALTGPGIEKIIVSDDGSTDATRAILADWAARDPRVELVFQPRNIGPIENFDTVARRAVTPLFMFAAHDDAWSATYVDELRSALAERPRAQLAYARNILMNDDFSAQTKVIPAVPIVAKTRGAGVRRALRIARSGWFYGLYRTEALLPALDAVRVYGHPWGHDFVTLLPFLLSGEIACSDRAVFYQRLTTRSQSYWCPQSAAGRLALNWALRKAAASAVDCADLSGLEKASLLPALHTYVGRHSFKLRDIAARHATELVGLAR